MSGKELIEEAFEIQSGNDAVVDVNDIKDFLTKVELNLYELKEQNERIDVSKHDISIAIDELIKFVEYN